MSLKKTIEVEINVTANELAHEIRSRDPLALTWIFRAVSETLTVKMLEALSDFVGSPVKNQEFAYFAQRVFDFNQRVQKVAKENQ